MMTPLPDLKRYKALPPEHFSRLRGLWQSFCALGFISPFVFLTRRPIVYGRQHIPRKGSFLIAANHLSLLDPPLVWYAIRRPMAFMAKKELFNTWLKAEFYYSVGCFALDRDRPDRAALKTAINVLRSPGQWALCLFPEGTRSTTGEVLPLKKGFGSLAHKTGAPVLPVGITQDPSDPRQRRAMVTIGELITDVSDPEQVQQQTHAALVHLANPHWPRQ